MVVIRQGFTLLFSILASGFLFVPGLQAATASAASALTAEQRVLFIGVLVRGVTAFEPLDFLPLYERRIGEQLTVGELKEIASAIESHYHKAGYRATRVWLSEQAGNTGLATIAVQEGVISAIRWDGEMRGQRALLERFLTNVSIGRPYRSEDLERAILLMNDLPGLSVSAHLQPPAEGAVGSELVLRIKQTRYQGRVQLDNRGSDIVGQSRLALTASSHSLFSQFETLTVTALHTLSGELAYLEGQGRLPVGGNGASLTLAASHSDADPSDFYAPLDIAALTDIGRLGWRYPLLRTAKATLGLSLDYNYYDANVFIDGDHVSEDVLHDVVVGSRLSGSIGGAYARFGVALTQSLDSLNKSRLYGSAGTREQQGRYSLIALDGLYQRTLAAKYIVSIALAGQYSHDELPSSQRFLLGGASYGGAYDPAEISGDHGIKGKVKLRAPLPAPSQRGWSELSSWYYGYYDIGRVWAIAESERQSAASAGVGAGLSWHGVSAHLEVAQPLTRGVALEDGSRAARVFAGVSVGF